MKVKERKSPTPEHGLAGPAQSLLEAVPQPTRFGQDIIDALCDHLAEHDHAYWVPMMDHTPVITRWLMDQLGKKKMTIAGGVAHLVDQGLLSTGWHSEYGRTYELSVRPQGWCRWHQFSIERLSATHHIGASSDEELIDWWLDWDGLDGTMVGYEHEVKEAGIFQRHIHPR